MFMVNVIFGVLLGLHLRRLDRRRARLTHRWQRTLRGIAPTPRWRG
jgi:hypothetical protein